MDEIGESSWLGHWGRGDRVQIGDDRFGVGVDARTNGQSGESGAGVELEERGLEVLAIQEVDRLELNVNTELSAERYIRIRRVYPQMGRYSHGNLSNGSPDGVVESVYSWLAGGGIIRRPAEEQGLAENQP